MQPEWRSWDLKPGCLSDAPAQPLLQPWLRTCWRKSTVGLPRPWGACPTLSLCLLQTCHPDFISSNTPISFQPQGLCTCYSFCLGRPSTYSLHFLTSAYPSGLQQNITVFIHPLIQTQLMSDSECQVNISKQTIHDPSLLGVSKLVEETVNEQTSYNCMETFPDCSALWQEK